MVGKAPDLDSENPNLNANPLYGHSVPLGKSPSLSAL